MPAAHRALLHQQPCTQAGCMHSLSSLRCQPICYVRRLGTIPQSQLPRHSWLSVAASSTTSPCRMPCSTVQICAASSSTSQNSGSMSHDNPLALAFLGDAIWSVSRSLAVISHQKQLAAQGHHKWLPLACAISCCLMHSMRSLYTAQVPCDILDLAGTAAY